MIFKTPSSMSSMHLGRRPTPCNVHGDDFVVMASHYQCNLECGNMPNCFIECKHNLFVIVSSTSKLATKFPNYRGYNFNKSSTNQQDACFALNFIYSRWCDYICMYGEAPMTLLIVHVIMDQGIKLHVFRCTLILSSVEKLLLVSISLN